MSATSLLVRPRRCVLGGVSAGLAAHLGASATLIRAGFILTTLLGGAGVLLYLWLWALSPLTVVNAGASVEEQRVRRRVPIARVLLSFGMVFALAMLLAQFAGLQLSWLAARLLPELGRLYDGATNGTAIVFGLLTALSALAAVGWDQYVENRELELRSASRALRYTSGGLLVFVSLVLLTGGSAPSGIAALLALIAALTVLVGPWAGRLWQELVRERTARVREEQRAEIAAHLHDSVLQTLALIQTRAGAASEVARIARAQERELRDWLYAGDAGFGGDVVAELREWANVLELDYPARVEFVAAGAPTDVPAADVVAAAREAMLNAARHAGGDISVYIEGATGRVDVWVRDAGPGFDPGNVAADRLGVRESIVGRMQRSGGWATVRRGPGGLGTEVHAHWSSGGEDA